MNRFAIVIALLAIIPAFVAFTIATVPPTPPVTVPYVDIKKYLGTWYEQAVIPFFFERNCTKTTATYSLNTNGSVRVEYISFIIQQ
jgi:apolipoprotein D and lipocalin family protein